MFTNRGVRSPERGDAVTVESESSRRDLTLMWVGAQSCGRDIREQRCLPFVPQGQLHVPLSDVLHWSPLNRLEVEPDC